MAERKKEWYVLRAISGKEAKVKELLDAAIKNTDLGNYVSQVLIPTEKVVTTRNGKRVVKERNLYSGYVAPDEDNDLNDDGFNDFMVGEHVKVTFGPFSGFNGEIVDLDAEKRKLKVEVKIFGRSTPLELEASQVERELAK